MDIEKLIRKNILSLKPYSCARDEFKGVASVYLDANESPYNAPLNRYPDPLQLELKKHISDMKGVPVPQIFLGNGSDEPIDLLFRAFCEPAVDNVIAIEPTYGMYKVCADINHVAYRTVLLNSSFDFCADELLAATDSNTKIIWLCSPNNPTGNSLNRKELFRLLRHSQQIVVVDEAYIDFSIHSSLLSELHQYPNLVILQTFSKAWASAAIRLGMAFASETIIQVLNKIKYPYNINLLTQQQALKAMQNKPEVDRQVAMILQERELLVEALHTLRIVKEVYPTDANFVLVKVNDAPALYHYLVQQSIIVRNRSSVQLCTNCIRITVGTADENRILLDELHQFSLLSTKNTES